MSEALSRHTSVNDWSSFFWAVHPEGNAILDQIEIKLALKKEKKLATQYVFSEFGITLDIVVLRSLVPISTIH